MMDNGRIGRLALSVVLGLAAVGFSAGAAGAATLEEIGAMPRDEQLEPLQKWIKANPKDVAARLQLGAWYYDENRLEESLEQFQRALAIEPTNFKALVNACLVFENSGRSENALALYEGYLKEKPNDASAMAFYGETLWSMDRHSAAINWYRKAIEIDAKNSAAHFNMGVAFAEMGIYREAVREWQIVVSANDSPDLVRLARDNIKKAEEKL